MVTLADGTYEATERRHIALDTGPLLRRLRAVYRLWRRHHQRQALERAIRNQTADAACLADFGITGDGRSSFERALAQTMRRPWTNG